MSAKLCQLANSFQSILKGRCQNFYKCKLFCQGSKLLPIFSQPSSSGGFGCRNNARLGTLSSACASWSSGRKLFNCFYYRRCGFLALFSAYLRFLAFLALFSAFCCTIAPIYIASKSRWLERMHVCNLRLYFDDYFLCLLISLEAWSRQKNIKFWKELHLARPL